MNEPTKVYFDDIVARAASAPVVPRRVWNESLPASCHKNCEAYVTRFDGFDVVRGWLIVGGHWLMPHSVVRDVSARTLIDVTPEPTNSRLPFVEHFRSEDDFQILRQGRDGGFLHPEPIGFPSDYAPEPIDQFLQWGS